MNRKWIVESCAGFLTLLGLVLALVIILFVFFVMMNTYFKKPVVDSKSEKFLLEQGLSTSGQQAILDSTRKKVQDYNQQTLEREKEVEQLLR